MIRDRLVKKLARYKRSEVVHFNLHEAAGVAQHHSAQLYAELLRTNVAAKTRFLVGLL